MALRKTLPIKPRPADAPPRDGEAVYDPKRGGWIAPAGKSGKAGGRR